MINPALFSSKTPEHPTPQAFFDKLDQEFHFTLDVAATPENAKCQHFFTQKDDGLSQFWGQETVWMNPPYGRTIGLWVEKAYVASLIGATVVCLLPVRTDTKWWHEWVEGKAEVRFVRGRLKFGDAKNSAPFPSVVVIFRGL